MARKKPIPFLCRFGFHKWFTHFVGVKLCVNCGLKVYERLPK